MPLHEEILGADIVEHSINGSYDKSTGDWFDGDGQIVMTVDKSNQESYDQSIRSLQYHMREDNPDSQWVRRRSFMGFSRGRDVVPTNIWANGHTEVNRGSDRSSGFISNEHSPQVATISVSNGIYDRPSLPQRSPSVDNDGVEVLVVPDDNKAVRKDFWPEQVVPKLTRQTRRNKRVDSR